MTKCYIIPIRKFLSNQDKAPVSPPTFFSLKYLVISISLSVLSMLIVVYMTYSPGIFEHLKLKRLPGLVIAVIVSMMRVWFQAGRFRVLSEGKLSWMASIRIVLSWDFTSSVTPSTIGGAPMATYAMTKEGVRLGKSSAIILYGVLMDQLWFSIAIPIIFVSSFFVAVIPQNIGWIGESAVVLIYLAILSYAGLLAYAVLVNPSVLKRVVRAVFKLPILRRWYANVDKESENLESYSRQLGGKPRSFIAKAFGLTLLTWLARIWLPTIVVLSLLPADVILSLLRSLAMNLTFLAMPTPGGSGGVEGLFAIFQGPLIERKGFIGLAVFLWRVITYYITIALGVMATTWYINQKIVTHNYPKADSNVEGIEEGETNKSQDTDQDQEVEKAYD